MSSTDSSYCPSARGLALQILVAMFPHDDDFEAPIRELLTQLEALNGFYPDEETTSSGRSCWTSCEARTSI